jgi:two-component system, chemotaxis family, chemotaxis protein CheY
MSRTILIADDSESVREVICYTLESAGYKVFVGVDGNDACKFLDGTAIDLILTDLHMPGLDGIGFIKKVRANANYSFTPILFLTTESQISRKEEAKAAGATGWIVKPFMPEKLLATIQKVLR